MNDRANVPVQEHRILELMSLLVRRRKTYAWFLVIFAVTGLAAAFLVTRYYKSVSRILPPKESSLYSSLGGLSSLVRSLPTGISRLAGATEDPYNYIAILRSRTVTQDVIRRFSLISVYQISDSSVEKAVREFNSNTEIEWNEDNALEIRVWDKDAKRAAAIANYLVALLNERSVELQTQEARNNRIFIEQRVNQNRIDLRRAEDSLQEYQEKVGTVVAFDPEGRGIASVAELYGMKARKEIELGILSRTVSGQNPLYEQAQMQLKAIDSQLDKIPAIGVASYRLMREVAIQQKIMEYIIPLYEQAKINEHKDVPVAYVLDVAVPGEKPDRPKRLFILGIAIFVGLLLASLTVAYTEYERNLSVASPDQFNQLLAIKRIFRLRWRHR